MRILAVETSCDETAAAVVDGNRILSSVIATSRDLYERWGGVVPEVASREQLRTITPVLAECLHSYRKQANTANSPPEGLTIQSGTEYRLTAGTAAVPDLRRIIESEIDMLAVTVGPGLIGSLLVGVETMKTIAYVCQKPIVPVNHVVAHMFANFIADTIPLSSTSIESITYPAISLVASGGHTELYRLSSPSDIEWLGGTIDDAAGECFDKTARLIGFGSGGGSAIERAADQLPPGDVPQLRKRLGTLPRPLIHEDGYRFSFSGLKTAVLRQWRKIQAAPGNAADHVKVTQYFAYEIQEAITDVLTVKTLHAADVWGASTILLSGGVAANRRLRSKISTANENGAHVQRRIVVPQPVFCTDNAVGIGICAGMTGIPTDWKRITAVPELSASVVSQYR